MANSALTTLIVCTTCRRGQDTTASDRDRAGAQFFRALSNAVAAAAELPDIRVQPVECLLNCTRGCNIALRAEGKWSYHFGDLDPDVQLDNVLALAAMHHAAADGEVPWGRRPEAIKRNAISRLPPISKDT